MRDGMRSAHLNPLTLSVGFGIIMTIVVGLSLYTLGLTLLEAAVFGVLGGFTMGAVLYREQNLIRSSEHARKSFSRALDKREQRLRNIYDYASCCLVEFDAETHIIEKASLGFVNMLAIPLDGEVKGKSILDVLRVESKCLVDLLSEVKSAPNGVMRRTIRIAVAGDSDLVCEFAAIYYDGPGLIEIGLYHLPEDRLDGNASNVSTREDFDRFRRGLYRRETRILELKEEVNKVLIEHDEKPRYKFDQRTNDSPVPMSARNKTTSSPDE